LPPMCRARGAFRVHAQFSVPRFGGRIGSIDIDRVDSRYALGVTDNGFYFLYDVLQASSAWCLCLREATVLSCACFLAYDRGLFVTGSYDHYLRIYDTESPREPVNAPIDLGHCINGCDFNGLRPVVAAALDDGLTRLFDLREDVNLAQLSTHSGDDVTAVRWVPGSDSGLAVGDAGGRVILYDIRSPQRPFRLAWSRGVDGEPEDNAHESGIVGLEFAGPHRLGTPDEGGLLRQWDIDSGTASWRQVCVDAPRGSRRVGFFVLDGRVFAPSGNAVVDVDRNEGMVGHMRRVTWVARYPEGFVSASEDAFLCVWRAGEAAQGPEDESDWSD